MSSAPREPGEPGEDAAWQDIVSRLDGEVFTEVPDIISSGPAQPTPPSAGNVPAGVDDRSSAHPSQRRSQDDAPDSVDDDDDDPFAFVPPDPPPVRLSRNTKIGWSCVAGGPLIYGVAEATGLLDDAVQVLSFGLLITGAFLLLRNLPDNQPDEDDSAPV